MNINQICEQYLLSEREAAFVVAQMDYLRSMKDGALWNVHTNRLEKMQALEDLSHSRIGHLINLARFLVQGRKLESGENVITELVFRDEQEKQFAIDGYLIPYITGIERENGWDIILNNRFLLHVERDMLDQYLWFAAHAMAIAAGFTQHGADSHKRNIHQERYGQASPDDEET